ncbi:uncharacterized protein LOC142587573 isoform X2 [Dermacentor variabilis]|uniref:uncharacterized protein LOC142587573 isoform X2 n=1 Tax=Dermacentor variabilis TaxID=34621 RepID=UPI003F5B584A
MTCENFFAAILISIIFTDLKSQVHNSSRTYPSPWDIRLFVSRGQPIWTYNTTERTHKTCKVDLVQRVTTVFLRFNRSYDYHGQRHATDSCGKNGIHESRQYLRIDFGLVIGYE